MSIHTYSPHIRNLISRAFYAGFSVSREGFNGECDFGHLAPDSLGEGYDWTRTGECFKYGDCKVLDRLLEELIVGIEE